MIPKRHPPDLLGREPPRVLERHQRAVHPEHRRQPRLEVDVRGAGAERDLQDLVEFHAAAQRSTPRSGRSDAGSRVRRRVGPRALAPDPGFFRSGKVSRESLPRRNGRARARSAFAPRGSARAPSHLPWARQRMPRYHLPPRKVRPPGGCAMVASLGSCSRWPSGWCAGVRAGATPGPPASRSESTRRQGEAGRQGGGPRRRGGREDRRPLRARRHQGRLGGHEARRQEGRRGDEGRRHEGGRGDEGRRHQKVGEGARSAGQKVKSTAKGERREGVARPRSQGSARAGVFPNGPDPRTKNGRRRARAGPAVWSRCGAAAVGRARNRD